MSLYDVGESVSFGEAIHLVNELRREWGTHLHAEANDWEFPVRYGEVMQLVQAAAYLSAHRDPKDKKRPVELPKPWHSGNKPRVTAEERAALEQQLERRSAFR